MKKKVLLTIFLSLSIILFIGLAISLWDIIEASMFYTHTPVEYINAINKRTAQCVIFLIFIIVNILIYLWLIIKVWKINYNIKNSYEQWKIKKAEKEKQKIEQKKKKLEEKLKKLQ